MSYIYDIAAVAIIIILSVIGYKKGILISLLGIVSLVAAGAVSFFFSDMAIGLLGFENYAWSKPAFKVGMFALACVLFGVLSRWISKGVNKIPVLGKTNKILGAFLGFLQSLLILFIIYSLLWCILKYIPIEKNRFFESFSNSYIYKLFDEYVFIYYTNLKI